MNKNEYANQPNRRIKAMIDFLVLGVKYGLLGVATAATFAIGATLLLPLVNGAMKLMSMMLPTNGGKQDE